MTGCPHPPADVAYPAAGRSAGRADAAFAAAACAALAAYNNLAGL